MAKTAQGFMLVVLAGGFSPLSGAEDRKTLELVWLDHHKLFHDFERARAEADTVFSGLGVAVRWEEATDPEPAAPGELRIQIVLMPSEPSGWRLSRNAMGVVLLPNAGQQESVYLFYPAILRSAGLGNTTASMLKPRERKDVARAIGRVIVHEVIHAVSPRLAHADRGLMHQSLSANKLSGGDVRVDERSKQAFLQGLAQFERVLLKAAQLTGATP